MIKLNNTVRCGFFLENLLNKTSYLINIILAVFIPVGIGSVVLNPYFITNKFTIPLSLDSLIVMFLIGIVLTLILLWSLYFINQAFFQINISKRIKNVIDMILVEGALFGIGFSVFFCYFQKNSFFPSISYSLLISIFAISLVFLLISYIIFYLLKCFVKNISLKIIITFNILLLVGTIAFNGITLPKLIVKLLGLGNYRATLVLTEEACQTLANIPGLSISPKHTLDNILVFWSEGERWFVEVKDRDNQGMVITLKNDFISKVISKK